MKRLDFTGKGVLIALGGYAILQFIVGTSFTGTFDAGDSVQHYLNAHHLFAHPELFWDHWGKPVFTAVSAPYAYFGFGGMKVLNCLLALGTAWTVYRSAIRLGFSLHWLAPLFVVAAPSFFLAQYSGLTEPMFAFVLLLGIHLLLRGNWWLAVLLLSFLPFIRTEGFLLLPIFAAYLFWQGKIRLIFFLALGTLIISIIGLVHYDTIFWVFTRNPYDQQLLNYGQGSWWHFPEQYIYVVGLPLLGLIMLGWMPWALITKPAIPRMLIWDRVFLIYLPFFVYFFAHVVFWANGIAHSMGMLRVMIAIQPLAALIALAGLSGLIRLIPEKLPWAKKSFAIMVATFVAIFPFFSSPAAIHSKDLELTTDQKCLVELKPWFVEQNFSGVLHYYDHPSVAWIFDLDPFDSLQSRHLLDLATIEPTPGSIMIWDSWFAVNEAGVSAGFWEIDGKYELLKCVERTEYGKHSKVCIWRKR